MMPFIYKITFLVIAFSSFTSCCSTKKNSVVSENNSNVETQNMTKKMIQEGYSKGTVLYSDKESDCEYVLVLEDGSTMFDPINLDNAFKKDGMKVWFTFFPLRRMNRCDKASPVNLNDIQKRDE